MTEIMKNAVESSTLPDLVKKFIPEALGAEITKACQVVYPLQSVFIRKVKTIKTPRFDVTRLMEMHGDTAEDVGKAVKDSEVLVEALTGAGGRL